MPELPNYITPDQLKEIGQTIATAIAAAKDLPTVTLDELNAENIADYSKLTLRKVLHSTGAKIMYGYVLTLNMTVAYTQVYIGTTSSTGETEALGRPAVSAYGGQPGLSIAIRHNVTLNTFDKTIVSDTGQTPWHVTQIADYNGLLALGGSDTDSSRLWDGNEAEYNALTERDPKKYYFIKE